MVDWRFTLKRAARFMRTILNSKMAAAGVVILVAYSFLAVAAPIVTPYDPQRDIVAGSYSPPVWYRYFEGGSRLSENQLLEPSPGFATDPLSEGWTLATSTSRITAAYDPATTSSPGSGSLAITLDRSTPLSGSFAATVKKPFTWSYDGPPARFEALAAILTPTASSLEPVHATMFLERLSDMKRWNLTSTAPDDPSLQPPFVNPSWNGYPFSAAVWHRPSHTDSNDDVLKQNILGVDINPAQLIFSSPDDYAYGVIITFTSASPSTQPQQVFLDEMNLRLYGTAWGWLGTQVNGYDLFAQLIYGARISLIVGLLSAVIGIVLGLIIGLVAGYMGKIVDEVLMRFTDMLLVIPTLPLLIVLLAVLGNTLAGGGVLVLILVIGFLGWMGFARVVRAQVLSLKERPFVEAAKAAGASTSYITVRHIIPNIVGLIYVNLALAVPGAILAEAALSFLGLGPVTVLSWGKMLNEVQVSGGQRIWWWVLPPGLSIALVSLAFVMIGFSLDTLFNPKLRERR